MFRSRHRVLELAGALFLLGAATPARAGTAGPLRFHSPSGRFDLVVETLPDDWTHAQKAKPGAVRATRDQFAIFLYVAGSSEPVNVLYYSDQDPPVPPADVVQSIHWSPHEEYLVLPDKQKAREGNHIFQLAAPTYMNKVWSLEADHVQWMDDRHFVGDHNTHEIPGGVMIFDGNIGKAELLIAPDPGIGYQIASVSGRKVTVKEFLNHLDNGKTAWDLFTPACFDLDLDTLKKRSAPCPK